jgi:hypothetical protein
MKNTHQRLLAHPTEDVRSWIARAWSGTEDDVFPRDWIPTWRLNPPGVGASELLVGRTRLGHGPFAFTLTVWDTARWRVEVEGGHAWHGFEFEASGDRTLITHTLEGELGLGFRLFLVPVHDWAVESLFDRLEIALATGKAPRKSERPMGIRASAALRTMRFLKTRSARRRVADEMARNSVGGARAARPRGASAAATEGTRAPMALLSLR